MRFVRHPGKPDWSIGVVAAEDAHRIDILFEGFGHQKIASSFKGLRELADEDVPADSRLRKRENWPAIELDGRRAEAQRELPKRVDGFIAEFLELFPGGLQSPECDETERAYKVAGSAFARKELDPEVLDALLAEGAYAEILLRARRSLHSVNLAFPNELTKFSSIPASSQQQVAEKLVRLVKAGDDTPAALESLAVALRPHEAAKWPIVSLLPFLLDPQRWPFVKPTFIERATAATGIDVEYDPQPNARTYGLVRDLYLHVTNALVERNFAPRDFIDVHTFLWVASGLAREERAKKKARKVPQNSK